MTKTITFGRFLRNAGTGFAGLCFAGLLAVGTGCLPAASNDTGPSAGSSGNNSSSSSGGGSGSSSSSSGGSTGSSGGSSSSSSSSSSAGGGGSTSSSSSKAGAGGSSSSGGGGGSSSSSSSSSASGGGGSGGTTTPTGGSTGVGPTGTEVTFSSGKGVGAMTGYGWVAFGEKDSLTDPLCGTEKFTSTTKCAQTTWSTKDSLCISGSIPALPDSPTSADYTSNWGVQVGLDATEAKGTLGQSFSSITIKVSGSPSSGLRAKIHKKGDLEGSDYCVAYTSGAITLTSFAKDCYNTPPGTALTAADVPNIDQIGLQVPSGKTAIDVKNLCITGITFAK